MNHTKDCGLLAHCIAAGQIQGNFLDPIPDDRTEHFKRILAESKPGTTIDHVTDYFDKILLMEDPADAMSDQHVKVAYFDALLRAKPDTGEMLHERTPEIMQLIPISRGGLEEMIKALNEKRIIP